MVRPSAHFLYSLFPGLQSIGPQEEKDQPGREEAEEEEEDGEDDEDGAATDAVSLASPRDTDRPQVSP